MQIRRALPRALTLMTLGLAWAGGAAAQEPPCKPCAGLQLAEPRTVLEKLASPAALADDERFYLAWNVELDGTADVGLASEVAAAGATPWQRLLFRTQPPLSENAAALEAELSEAARMAAAATPTTHFQIDWHPPSGKAQGFGADQYAFLLKRASVAIKGAQPEARVLSAPLGTNATWIRELYTQDIAAYLEGLTLESAEPEDLASTLAVLAELDAGRPVSLVGAPRPAEPLLVLAEAARQAAAGFAVTLFDAGSEATALVAPLKTLAREFKGDLALDPYSAPAGDLLGWAFVRGQDLGLRVIAQPSQTSSELIVNFSGSGLQRPSRLDPASGETSDLYGLKTRDGLEISILEPRVVELLRLERLSASEIEGIEGLEEELLVTSERQLPVEEILRRLQAFEDAQARQLRTYRAVNTTHLRYQAGTGAGTIETTFRGRFFVADEGFDWAWEEFLINGIRWRSNRVPEIPIIQPEKAAVAPVEITFTRDYRYRLRGTEVVEGRDCWVVEFEPAAAVEEGRSLYRGTVWVDREIYARVKTRAIQLGLAGEVLSSDETTFFSPVDAAGDPADWTADSFFLPLRLTGQQIWSVLSASIVVEREVLLSEVLVNDPDFATARQAALDSEVTMVRDTEEGLRYIVADAETGERVVKPEIDGARRFIAAGVIVDESQDFPIPLAGINWLWFDWRGTGTQADVFLAGPLAVIGASKPSFRGSKFDLGFDLFALAIPFTDTLFRNGQEVEAEDVETFSPSIDFKIGRPIGSFAKVDFQYELGYEKFSRADDTADESVLPSDHLTHELRLAARYNRRGYRVRGWASHTVRDQWEPWGLPGGDDFDPDDEEFSKWGLGIGKTWHLPKFFKFGAELEYIDGSHLDRFSKYGFGQFADVSIAGYQSDKVRAEEALAAHFAYGFGIGSTFRLDLVADVAQLTDREAGLEEELAAGVGIAGTLVGPWQTVIRVDVGTAVDGPDDGVSAFLTVLKLMNPTGKRKASRP